MNDPETFYFHLPAEGRPSPQALEESRHPDFEWLKRHRSRARVADPLECVDSIVIHATAGYATSHAVEAWRTAVASAHWIIPAAAEEEHGQTIWATVPEGRAAFHVRDSIRVTDTVLGPGPNVNDRSLGVELVNTQDVEDYTQLFSEWQVGMAAAIVRYAWSRYPRLSHVISHAKLDPLRRADPGRQFPWDVFRQQVIEN